MNTKQLTAVVVLFAAAGTAMAEAPYPPETRFVSTKSRAEVISELQQAQAQGLITNGNNYPIVIQGQSRLSRTQVIGQLRSAGDNSIYAGA